ncbi:aldolase/citrate lyase family protein [Actinobacillus delphinicola]|uniref:Citrate lyase beta subunit n=1 Tax=Actinobacillus delphinicola TaxID=51161 RepID=A0A448TV72_9PAST|nr:aldolase/citrate lyase family protein [Actinobacillus delphinicola]VEJ09835.1 Citrate lyase beta subunit [Actinobacillus delphinicola]
MKFMIIENNIDLIKFYDSIGIDRIFIDLEVLGKKERQGHLDTVITLNHSITDINKIKPLLKKSKLLVRVNPININSKYEIEQCIQNGADIIMLPMFKRVNEVKEFLTIIGGRVRTCLLLETSEAVCRIDDILDIPGIDEVHIGLNDLHLAYGLDFMFELLTGGIIELIVNKLKKKNIPFGIGGIATCQGGAINGRIILGEYIRLGATQVILSRSFKKIVENSKDLFLKEINKLNNELNYWNHATDNDFYNNRNILKEKVLEIIN